MRLKIEDEEHPVLIFLIIVAIILLSISAIFCGVVYVRQLWYQQHSSQQISKLQKFAKPKQVTRQESKALEAGFHPDFSIPAAEDGLAPVLTNFSTSQPVVFLTIDDGAYKDQSVVDFIKANHVKASLFLAQTFIVGNPDFFKQITALGSFVEDHTLSHDVNMATDQSYAQQKSQICGMADYEQAHYGRRPIFFRPPGGAYSKTMRKVAYDCGMKAVVTWIAKANGGSMQYQIGHELHPGDIVLMHFRPTFKQDLQAFLDAAKAAGLRMELLEDLPIS